MKYLGLIWIGSLVFFGCKEDMNRKFKTPAKPVNIEEILLNQQREMVKKDSLIIADYLIKEGNDFSQSGTGLRYKIIEQSAGELVKSGERVFLEYVITDLKMDTLYTSEKSGIMKLEVDFSRAESGLHELVKYMRKGEKAVAILPPHLGHGLAGDDYKIPAYTILKFEVKVLK